MEAVREADASVLGSVGDATSLRHASLLDEKDVTSLRHEVTLMHSTLEEKEVEVETLRKEVESLNAFQVSLLSFTLLFPRIMCGVLAVLLSRRLCFPPLSLGWRLNELFKNISIFLSSSSSPPLVYSLNDDYEKRLPSFTS